MKDLIQNLKEQIKDKQAELSKLEKALAALTGEKPVPKARAASGAAGTAGSQRSAASSASSAGATTQGKLPDRIIASLAVRDDQGADSLAQELQAPLGQVRTVCSRLAREGRISSRKIGKQTSYLSLKSEQPTTENPFEAN